MPPWQEEAARSLTEMTRDAHSQRALEMTVQVLDNNGPVLEAKFTFELVPLGG